MGFSLLQGIFLTQGSNLGLLYCRPIPSLPCEPPGKEASQTLKCPPAPFLLVQHGFSDIKVEDTAKGHIVLLQEAETLIQIEEDSTHIICDDDEVLRVRLRDLVLKFLQKS